MNTKHSVWIVHLEVLSFTNDACAGKVGFLDAVVEAEDCFSAEERVALMLRDHNCEILEIAKTVPLDSIRSSDGVSALVRQLRANPERILLSEISCHEQEQQQLAA